MEVFDFNNDQIFLLLHHYCLLQSVKFKRNSLMRNIISSENLVALLKCVLLHLNQIWDKYASRTVRFRSNSQFPSKEVFRTPCGQVQRLEHGFDSVSLEPTSPFYVRTAYELSWTEGTYRYNNRPC